MFEVDEVKVPTTFIITDAVLGAPPPEVVDMKKMLTDKLQLDKIKALGDF